MPVQINGSSGDAVTVPEGTQLRIVAGQVVKLFNGLLIDVSGDLNAVGTEDNPIHFTSYRDDSVGGDSNNDGSDNLPVAGDWEGIVFRAGSDASRLQHVRIQYAGNQIQPNDFRLQTAVRLLGGAAPELRDLLIQSVETDAIRVEGAGRPMLENIVVDQAKGYPFTFDLATDPVLSRLVGLKNTVNALRLDGGAIPEDRVWAVTNLPYVFTGDISIPESATLKIEPGAVLKFAHGQLLTVDGTLDAQGSLTQPIVFTSRDDDTALGDTFGDGANGVATPGDWESILFNPTSGDSVLDRVDVRYAGNAIQPNDFRIRPAISIVGASPTVRNTRILSAELSGIHVSGDASPLIEQVQVRDSLGEAFVVELASAPTLRGLSAVNNGADRVLQTVGELPGNRVWDYGGLPVQLTGSSGTEVFVASGVTLRIVAGQTVKFSPGQKLRISGTLDAVGTVEQPIIFTSYRDDSSGGDSNNDGAGSAAIKGDWEGIQFESGSDASVLDRAEIRYAGNQVNPGDFRVIYALRLTNTAATIRNLLIREVETDAVRLVGGAPKLENVHVESASGVPFSADLTTDPSLVNLTGRNNRVEGILYDSGVLEEGRTFDVTTMPYLFTGGSGSVFTVAPDVTLTLAPGVVFKFGFGQRFLINGGLDARGTVSAPVLLTSRNDDTALGDTFGDGSTGVTQPGDWEGLAFASSSSENQIDYVEIRYAGNQVSPGDFRTGPALRVETDLNPGHLTIRHSLADSILVRGGAALTLEDALLISAGQSHVVVENGSLQMANAGLFSAANGVRIVAGGSASVENSVFERLTTAVVNLSGDFENALFSAGQGNWWGDPDGPNDASAADGRVNENPNGVPIGDFVEYTPFLAVRPLLPIGPIVLRATPGLVNGPVSSIDVTFSEPVAVDTFTVDDIRVTGPETTVVSVVDRVGGATLSMAPMNCASAPRSLTWPEI